VQVSPEARAVTEPRPTYWPGLDGLRAFAVLSVMAYHLGRPEATGGFLGVDVFFVLSGFLITDLLTRELGRTGHISFRRFYARRALRLFPALALVIVLSLVCSLVWRGQPWAKPTLEGLPFVVLYVGNWYRAFGDNTTLGLLVHTWSLAIEEQYYLLWPWVLTVLTRRGLRARTLSVLLVVAALVIAGWRLALAEHGVSLFRIASGLDTHADGLLLGGALAFAVGTRPALGHRVRRVLAGLVCVAVVGLLGLVMRLPPDVREAEFGYLAAALATAVIVCGLATESVPPLTRVLELAPLTWIGRRSYGLYLWHFPLFLMLADRTYGPVPGSVVGVVVTFAAATLSFRFVEQPFLRLKSRVH
jgi:peptidoglycan/LPS O-acetylase OafA/YrhL